MVSLFSVFKVNVHNEIMDQFSRLTKIFVVVYTIIIVRASGMHPLDVVYTPMRTRFYTQESDVMLHLTLKNPCTLIPYMYENRLNVRDAAKVLGDKCQEIFYRDTKSPLNELCEKTHDENILKNLTDPSTELVFKTDFAYEFGPFERVDKSDSGNRVYFEMNVNYEDDDNYRLALWRKLNETCQSGDGQKTIEHVKWLLDMWVEPSWTKFLFPQDVCPVKLLLSHLYEKHSLVKDTVLAWKQDFINPSLLKLYGLNLTETYALHRPFKCYRDLFTASFHFQLKKKIIDRSTLIKKAEAFDHWINTPDGNCIQRYTGPNYFIHNMTSSCWKGVEEPAPKDMKIEEFSNATCVNARNLVEEWSHTECLLPGQKMWPLHQIKAFGDKTYIYCHPGKYFLAGEDAKECPDRPFLVKSGFSLNQDTRPSRPNQTDPEATTGLGVVFWTTLILFLIVLGLLVKDWSSEFYDIAVNSRIMRMMQSETEPSNVQDLNMTTVP